MLISKGRTTGSVVTLKLSSGEELIARLEEENAEGISIIKPMVLSMTPKGPGLMPYLFTVSPDQKITINNSAIIVVADTDKDFADQYLTSTTGITLA